MKTLRFFTAAVVAIASSLVISCTDNFDEINTNPNKVAYGKAAPSALFEPLLYGIGVNNQYQAWFFANELTQVTAFTGGKTTQIHQYQVTDGNWQSQWDNFARFGFDADHMVHQAILKGDKYYEALGLILKVYELSQLSALFGDIPYKEAYQQAANTTPVFDSQTELVDEFVADLDSAAVILARRPTISKTGLDKVYNDNYAGWIKFANSLKMRILCRMSGADDAYWARIQAMVDDPAKNPVFSSNSDNAAVPFQGQDPYRSYWGQNSTTESVFTSHRICETVINMMVEFNDAGNATFEDPRLPIYAVQKKNLWKGSRGGVSTDDFKKYDDGAAVPNFAILSSTIVPAFLMDYSEVLFILAEGVEKDKLNVPGQTAKSLYEAGVEASIAKWAEIGKKADKPVIVRNSDIRTLLTSSLASYDKAKAGGDESIFGSAEELIACQKYLSLFFCGYEVFNEWRRTEYPQFTPASGTVANEYEVPTRFGYPNYTVASNRANVLKALERMGGANNMHTPLDWSYVKKAGSHRNPYVMPASN